MTKAVQRLLSRMWVVPVLYVGMMAALIASTLHAAVRQGAGSGISASPVASAKPPSAVMATQAVGTQEKLDSEATKIEEQQQDIDRLQKYLAQRTDELERLITELMLGSGIYTALLGLFAYFGLKEAKSAAEQQIKDFKDEFKRLQDQEKADHDARIKEFDDLKVEVRADIPSLIGMQEALRLVLMRIRRQFDMSRVWTGSEGNKSYKSMTEEQRLNVLLAEMSVASFDYFRFQSTERTRPIAADIYAKLADFYAARAMFNPDQYDDSDMRRAHLYIDRACDMDRSSPMHFSQRAALTLTDTQKRSGKPTRDQMELAEINLNVCLELDPKHPSGLYNLAWIADERGEFARAAELLSKLVEQKKVLPAEARGARLVSAYVNRACAEAKLLRGLTDDEGRSKRYEGKLKQVLEDWHSAHKEAEEFGLLEEFRKTARREWSAGGDAHGMLRFLTADQVATVEGLKA